MTEHYTCATAAVYSVRLAPTEQVKTAWMGDQPCPRKYKVCIENLPMELQEPNFLSWLFAGTAERALRTCQ